ncbi:hypothetical protein CBS101457_002191 [Exobasidium rhododendri]|nr:hypothetical protein CBS101457_002191 [Exobasidium rhododendri]
MAATASNGIPTPNYQYGQAFSKITSVPLVKESLDAAHSTIESHPLLAQPFHFGENVVSHGLKAAEPVTTRLQPQLSLLDTYAVKGLDFAESKWSYPFTATSSDVYRNARQPADQVLSFLAAYSQAVHKAYEERVIGPAKSIYENRVAPAYDSANAQFQELKNQNAYLHRASEIVTNLQTNLAKTVESIGERGKADGESAAHKAQNLSNAIFAELDRVRGFALSLPAESRKRVHPVLETFTDTYEQLSKEARDTSLPPSQRFRNVLVFVREQSLPALQKAIVNPSTTPSAPAAK